MDIEDLTIGQLKFVNGKTLKEVATYVDFLVTDLAYDDFNRAMQVVIDDSESISDRRAEIKQHMRVCKF